MGRRPRSASMPVSAHDARRRCSPGAATCVGSGPTRWTRTSCATAWPRRTEPLRGQQPALALRAGRRTRPPGAPWSRASRAATPPPPRATPPSTGRLTGPQARRPARGAGSPRGVLRRGHRDRPRPRAGDHAGDAALLRGRGRADASGWRPGPTGSASAGSRSSNPTRCRILEVPPAWRLVAYLCVGYPVEEHSDPELDPPRLAGGDIDAATRLDRALSSADGSDGSSGDASRSIWFTMPCFYRAQTSRETQPRVNHSFTGTATRGRGLLGRRRSRLSRNR